VQAELLLGSLEEELSLEKLLELPEDDETELLLLLLDELPEDEETELLLTSLEEEL
jgi:hypothetical protein